MERDEGGLDKKFVIVGDGISKMEMQRGRREIERGEEFDRVSLR